MGRGPRAPSQSVPGVRLPCGAKVWRHGWPRPPSPPHGASSPCSASHGVVGMRWDHRRCPHVEVAGSHGFLAKVGLNCLLAGGVQGGNI